MEIIGRVESTYRWTLARPRDAQSSRFVRDRYTAKLPLLVLYRAATIQFGTATVVKR